MFFGLRSTTGTVAPTRARGEKKMPGGGGEGKGYGRFSPCLDAVRIVCVVLKVVVLVRSY